MIRILLVDDQRLMCDGLKSMLETDPNLAIVGVAETGRQALALAETERPDLVLLDIRMPEMDGVEAVLRLKRQWPDLRVVMLTTFDDEDYIWRSMANGADGYLLKDMEAAELLQAVGNAMAGQLVMPAQVAESFKKSLVKVRQKQEALGKLREAGFTPREAEIAELLADGFSPSQIASALFLSSGTVRNYISVVYEKLGVQDKTRARTRLQEMGLG